MGRKSLKILNLKCNIFPLSVNIWTKQARRFTSELKVREAIEIEQRNRDGGYDLPMFFFNNVLS